MNIRRINFALIVVLVVALATLTYSFFALQQTSKDLAVVEQRRVASYLIAYELRQSSFDLGGMARAYAATGGKPIYEKLFKQIAAIRDGKAEVPEAYHRTYWDFVLAGNAQPRPSSGVKRSLVDRARDAGMTEDEIALIQESYKLSNDLISIETEAFNATKGIFKDANGKYSRRDTPNKEYALALLYSDRFYAEKEKIMGAIDNFFVLMERHIKEETKVQLDAQSFLNKLFAFSALLSLLLIGAIVYLTILQNRRDLAERTEAQEKAEKENEQLNNSVINILQTMNQLSQRDLTAKAPVTEDIIGTVSDSVNALTAETSNVLLDVTDVAQQVNAASEKVKAQAQLVSQTAESDRENVTQMADALSHSSQSMTEVAQLTDSSNDSARKAALATQDALDTVKTTVNEMESIRETISQTEKRIKRLGERSQEISGIVGLINTISERTHVLALNASMQAAVAGEAGRGFAVVAEEVQRLAESSRNATEQIESLVKNIQIDTNETINTVNETISRVVKGSEEAEKAGEQMARTRDITAELVAQVIQISQAIEEQKSTSDNLLKSVQEIGMGAEKTARQIDEQNHETEQLQAAAKQLVESVGVFKLPKRAA